MLVETIPNTDLVQPSGDIRASRRRITLAGQRLQRIVCGPKIKSRIIYSRPVGPLKSVVPNGIKRITKDVCHKWKVPWAELRKRGYKYRDIDKVFPRGEICYRLMVERGISQKQCASLMNRRDHTTIRHCVTRFCKRYGYTAPFRVKCTDKNTFREDIETLLLSGLSVAEVTQHIGCMPISVETISKELTA